ncbi:hypothetical protein [Nocardioides sp. WS12]|uniref:hypothetical protein n=1 Tax=Nocardioides sp. WS12 TaxID=2486272 RepID=UPI0015FAEEDF|nr:hypothetical protein [Nocardioides sp. WS12]
MPPRLRGALIVVVTGVWAANFAAPIFIKDYLPPAEVHVIFMAVLGVLLGAKKPEDPPTDI